jgi:hypothetical protein
MLLEVHDPSLGCLECVVVGVVLFH